MLYNFHSHSHYCDGKGAPEDYVLKAIEEGFEVYGFSSHVPVRYPSTWNMEPRLLPDYVNEIRFLKEKYKDRIELCIGLETDYTYSYYDRATLIGQFGIDYTIGSVHYAGILADGRLWEVDGRNTVFQRGVNELFLGNTEAAVKHYFELTQEMLVREKPDILGHIDKIKIQSEDGKLFSEKNGWYKDAVIQTLETVRNTGTIVEINTRGWYKGLTADFYPSEWIIREMQRLQIPVMINTDAHQTGEISLGIDAAISCLRKNGYSTQRILQHGQWIDIPLNP